MTAKCGIGCILLAAILALVIIVAALGHGSPNDKQYCSEEYAIWDAQAPFGHYWTDTHGSFFLGSGSIHTDLRASYNIKYIDGDQLKTVLLPATDNDHVRLHLVSDNSTMRLVINNAYFICFGQKVWFDDTCTIWDIYLPDPKVMVLQEGLE